MKPVRNNLLSFYKNKEQRQKNDDFFRHCIGINNIALCSVVTEKEDFSRAIFIINYRFYGLFLKIVFL
ncbi:hypothetical protein D7V32_02250 [Acinetobacter tianfuensis]|uniref:Uncharacterized protein n=1 Tax=Acinetobacter tianfuensis TaxID=2419603 RepID=A0A3A8F079_9GAMM|nr:hypothetical protein D7V32_02250 [Acinetobacter tianfuensis]